MKVRAKVKSRKMADKTAELFSQSSLPSLEWTSCKVQLTSGNSAAELYVNGRDPAEGNPDFVLEFADNKLYIRCNISWQDAEDTMFVRAHQFNCVVLQRTKDIINESKGKAYANGRSTSKGNKTSRNT